MLTGDENIVDVDFTVFWRIKPKGVGDFLFNIQNPEGTVKAVAESAMREVVGRSEIQPILTGARQNIETGVQELMQKVLDSYQAGRIGHAGADAEGRSAGAGHRLVPRRSGGARRPGARAERSPDLCQPRRAGSARPRGADPQSAEAYREQTVAEAKGQASRFTQVYEQYKKAPDVTRERLYLETMERIFSGTDKIILDTQGGGGGGVVPFLPLNEMRRPDRAAADGRQPMNRSIAGGVAVVIAVLVVDPRLQLDVHRVPDPTGAGRSAGRAGPRLRKARSAL